jgi:hypothetical protein
VVIGVGGKKHGWLSLTGIEFAVAGVSQSPVDLVGATAPRPSCKPHAGSVYVFCGGDVLQKWGIGPEGEKRATGNCNHGCNTGRFKCPVKGSSWVAFGGEFGSPTYIVDGKRCTVSGLIKGGAWGHLATLPANCRPSKRLLFNLNNNAKTARVDVSTNGQVVWNYGGKDGGWISLTGIQFAVAGSPESGVPLVNGWAAHGGEYGSPTLYVETLMSAAGIAALKARQDSAAARAAFNKACDAKRPTCNAGTLQKVYEKDWCKCACDTARTGMTGSACDIPALQCENHGVVTLSADQKKASCVCPTDEQGRPVAMGNTCQQCIRKCDNDGKLDPDACVCGCPKQWFGQSCGMCALESDSDCQNDGKFNQTSCDCACPKGWRGHDCGIPVCFNGYVKEECLCFAVRSSRGTEGRCVERGEMGEGGGGGGASKKKEQNAH